MVLRTIIYFCTEIHPQVSLDLLEPLVEEYFSQRQGAFVCTNINVYIKCFDRDKWFKLAREESSVLFVPEATFSVVIFEFV